MVKYHIPLSSFFYFSIKEKSIDVRFYVLKHFPKCQQGIFIMINLRITYPWLDSYHIHILLCNISRPHEMRYRVELLGKYLN